MKNTTMSALSLMVILTACKIDQDPKKQSSGSFIFPNLANSSERLFNSPEVEIGKRICLALKKKRLHFETLSNNTHAFRGVYSQKSCAQNTLSNEKSFIVTLNNSNPIDMEYVSKEIDFNFKDVITDQSPIVKSLCDEIEKDTLKVSNTVRSNLVNYTISLKTVNRGIIYDRLEILKKVPTSSGETLIVQSGESYEFYTQQGQAEEKFMGVEVSKERYGVCDNPDFFSAYKEKFVKPLTSF